MQKLRLTLGNWPIIGLLVLSVTWFQGSGLIEKISLVLGIILGAATLVSKMLNLYKEWKEAQTREELRNFLKNEQDNLDRHAVEAIKEIIE